jgi:CDGSH-type Zn-finger protein
MEKERIQPGTTKADAAYHITVTETGPYLVFGRPPMAQQIIMPNDEGNSWEFREGKVFSTDNQPTALCRCGESRNKPYCDGAHLKADWDAHLTADNKPLLDGAETFDGPTLTLTDNDKFCVFARFCDANGRVWNLVGSSDDIAARELTIREANYCPGGRLSAWDKRSEMPFEPKYAPTIGLIEDPALHVSGGLWVRGGIPVSREDGITYEIRNRTVLCRCGQSSNKPFCDGTHASMKFKDGL